LRRNLTKDSPKHAEQMGMIPYLDAQNRNPDILEDMSDDSISD